jgi:hypothetical protein
MRIYRRLRQPGGGQLYQRALNIIYHSLYFPAVLNWMDILGQENALVVSAEKLRSRSASALASAHRNILNRVRSHHRRGLTVWLQPQNGSWRSSGSGGDGGRSISDNPIELEREMSATYNEVHGHNLKHPRRLEEYEGDDVARQFQAIHR